MSDETTSLLVTVRGELSEATARLDKRTRTEKAEVDELLHAAAQVAEKEKSLAIEVRALAARRTAAEEQRAILTAARARLQERLQAAVWSSVAVALLLAAMLAFSAAPRGSMTMLTLATGAAGLALGWLIGWWRRG